MALSVALPTLGSAWSDWGTMIHNTLDALQARTSAFDVTVKQNSDGTWPSVSRATGVSYRWFAGYDGSKLPTAGNGAAAGDEMVTPTGTTVIA